LLIELLKEDNAKLQAASIQALTCSKKKIDLHLVVEPFLLSESEAVREYAKKALK